MRKMVNGALVDMTQAEIDSLPRPPSEAEILAAWRANGFLSRAEFCVNANAMGLLTDADAEKAAAGTWPDSFEPIIASWPTAERIRARSKWATNANIYRNDPLLLLLAASLTPNLTDAQLDTLCGWAD